MSLYDVFREQWPEREKSVILTPNDEIRWGDLESRVSQAVHWLESKQCKQGDVVAIQMPKVVEAQAVILAALASGVTVLPLNPTYTDSEIANLLIDSGAKHAILRDNHPPELSSLTPTTPAASMATQLDGHSTEAHIEPQSPRQTAFLCYTSGTTGRPKGALINQGGVLHTLKALHKTWRWSSQDNLVHVLPMFHIHGLFVAQFGAYYAGATTHWFEKFEAQAILERLSQLNNAVFMGVPTHYHRFLQAHMNHTLNLQSVRLFTSGSAPLPAEVHQRFQAKYGHRILERYGMTEIGIALSNPYDGHRKPGTVGFPLPGLEAQICDEDGTPVAAQDIGELHIRGPSVMAGYLNRPQATERAIGTGWMKTGDLAKQDEEGYYTIVGRNKDMIISGGLNVYPREIETALLEYAGVETAAVVGIPDAEFGERVVAAITSSDNAIDASVLLSALRDTLAPYKCPKEIKVLPTLPRNAMGKVQKHLLRTMWTLYGQSEWSNEIQAALREIIRDTPTTGESPLAVFDFDNTCIAGDIGEAVLIALANLRGVDYLREYQRLCASEGKVIGYTWCATRCADATPDEIRQIAAQEFRAAQNNGTIKVRQGIVDLIIALERSGWDVWIVTASAEAIVQGVSECVGLPPERVIGLKLKVNEDTGVFLEEAIEPVTIYQGKLDAIRTYIGRDPTLGAGDSDTDYEMIAGAAYGLVIDRGQPKLAELSHTPNVWKQTGWTTRTLD